MKINFAVLIIDLAALEAIDPAKVGYYADNAARSDKSGIPFAYQGTVDAVKAMFAESPAGSRQSDHIPGNYTTYPQAEVLVKDIIPAEFIREIHFESINSYMEAGVTVPRTLVKIDSSLFKPRMDYIRWQKGSC